MGLAMADDLTYNPKLAQLAQTMLADSGLRLEEVAIKASMSKEYVRQLVSLGRPLSKTKLQAFAEATGGDPDLLLMAAGYMPSNTETISTDPLLIVQLRGDKQLSDTAKEQIEAFIRELMDREAGE